MPLDQQQAIGMVAEHDKVRGGGGFPMHSSLPRMLAIISITESGSYFMFAWLQSLSLNRYTYQPQINVLTRLRSCSPLHVPDVTIFMRTSWLSHKYFICAQECSCEESASRMRSTVFVSFFLASTSLLQVVRTITRKFNPGNHLALFSCGCN